jgi:hypothetical protein
MKENAWRWRKSSFSQPNGECVELTAALDAVRDSKNPAGPTLTIRTLPTLLNHIKEGRFD